MNRIPIAELEGAALDWAVLVAMGGKVDLESSHSGLLFATWDDLANSELFSPSTDWSQCGPLIERYGVDIATDDGGWRAHTHLQADVYGLFGSTALFAVCRAIVAAHNPDGFVEVPDDLAPSYKTTTQHMGDS